MNDQKPPKLFNPTDHLANDRTFLAWIRTNLGIMAFGFVVEKFNLFMHQISLWGDPSNALKIPTHSSIFGISLIGLGTLLTIFAFLQYKKTERQINHGAYHSSNFLNAVLAFLVFFIGIFLIFYMIAKE